MNQNNNNDLTRGFKEYDSKIKNIESILKKVGNIFDISNYATELNNIKDEVNNNKDLGNKMFSESFTLEYQAMVLAPYIDRLNKLTEKIESELLPFYELHLLSSKINLELADISAENIGDIIQYTKTLIDSLNSLNTHNDKNKNNIIENAYQVIYSVILYEELFEVSDILSYINYLNIPANKENIGELLQNDLKVLSKKELIEEDLRTIKKEGLGYDYLTQDFIRKISRNTIGNSNSEYLSRRELAISEISNKIDRFNSEKNELSIRLDNNKNKISNLFVNLGFLMTKAWAIVLVPVISIGAGNVIGKSLSNKITEYKTITRTVDFETGKIIGEPEEIYDENETTYVATVMVYGPWRRNPTGVGYIHDVSAYEYIAPDKSQEKYHITADDLENNLLEKYSYVETKDMLDKEDSTTDSTILITETYQDKKDTRLSKKFIIPFTIGGTVLGVLIDVLLVVFGIYDSHEIKRKLKKLKDEIEKYNLDNQEIINRLNLMKEEAILLQEEYNDVVKKYGTWEEKFNLDNDKASDKSINREREYFNDNERKPKIKILR